jgi:hypothetical protein
VWGFCPTSLSFRKYFKRRIKDQTITLHAGDDGSNRTSLSFKKDNGATMKKANGLFKMLGKADAQYGIER